jgi:putative ABC transport system permease protein
MLSPRWRKMLRDLWLHKARSALTVLSIAVGVLAVGMVLGARASMLRSLEDANARAHTAGAVLFTEPFDETVLASVQHLDGVRTAEGRYTFPVRLRVGAEEWRYLEVFALPDYGAIRLNAIYPERGAWPPPDRELLIERASLSYFQGEIGEIRDIETPEGSLRSMRIAGSVHDLSQPAAPTSGRLYAYVSYATLEWLGQPAGFNQLLLGTDEGDRAHIRSVADRAAGEVARSGRRVLATQVPEPGKFWAEDAVQATVVLLGVLGLGALALSVFLVVNTTSALLAQQVRQIGVMKVIGARPRAMVAHYVGMVLVLGALGFVLAMPLSAVAAYFLIGYSTGLINLNNMGLLFPPEVLGIEAAIGLGLPVLAAIAPILAGARITVREAITDYGMGDHQFGRSLLDRAFNRVRSVPRPLLLSLRATVRRRGRLALTLGTLILGGALFLSVLSVRSSLLLTLEDASRYRNYDIEVELLGAQPIPQIEEAARRAPGVARVESWGAREAVIATDAGGVDVVVLGLPAATEFVEPILVQGRWLRPDDQDAAVLNTDTLKQAPGLKVGDQVRARIDGRDTVWRVVGIVRGVFSRPLVYANYPHLAATAGAEGAADRLQVGTLGHDRLSQARVARDLETELERGGLSVRATQLTADFRAITAANFEIIITLLMVMAILMAIVGGLGLMGTMSINLLERTREIGVLRAIGASNRAVIQIVITEAVLIALVSWLFATLLAVPFSLLLTSWVGEIFYRAPISYAFSRGGVLLWLVLVIVLAVVASFIPAWHASRLTVRNVLAHE